MNQIHNQLERERDISRLVELQDAEALSRRQGDRSESCSTCGKTLGVPVVRFVWTRLIAYVNESFGSHLLPLIVFFV